MWNRLIRTRRGSVVVIVTMVSLVIIGVAAFAVDLGSAYATITRNQRLADLAAYSGALAYNSSGSTTAMNNAVSRIATLNGLSSSAITASVVASPTGDGNNAVQAQVITENPVYLATVLGQGQDLTVGGTAFAEIQSGVPGCITAIQTSGKGLSVTGGTGLTTSSCAVASNGTVPGQNSSIYVTCGAKITAPIVDYASSKAPVQSGCTSIFPPSGTSSVTFSNSTSTDLLATNSAVTTATSRLTSVAAISSPSAPSVTGGTAITFDYSKNSMSSPPLPSGCTGAQSGGVWTVSCPGSGTYTFGAISLAGGITLNLNKGAAAATRTFNFNGDINGSSGSAMTFGAGNYNIAGGIVGGGSMVMTWQGGGTFRIGTTSSCSAGSGYSICLSGSSRLSIPGASSFTLAGGIYQGASGFPPNPALSLGAGSTANTFTIGKSASGYSLNNANGATILGDASQSARGFSMAGGITTSGGSCVQIAAAGQHDINGSINAAGGVYLGAGIYTVNGYISFGASGGGDVSNCPTSGATTGLYGNGVSLILSGSSTTTCNGYSSSAFCLGAGYQHVVLTAPTSSSSLGSTTAGLAVVGPTSASLTGGANFTTGASNTQISGVFYFPYGALTMSGAAALHDTVDAGACLELVAASISLSGGSVAGSTCTGLNGSMAAGASSVVLVQ